LYWNWLTIVLLVLACIFVVIGILELWDNGETATALFIFSAFCAGGIYLNTWVHASDVRDKAAKAELQSRGINAVDVDTNNHSATLWLGPCRVEVILKKTGDLWLVYLDHPDGSRTLLQQQHARRITEACNASTS
jgi:hypothetical protein